MGELIWNCAEHEFRWGIFPSHLPLIMGILNTTPDSFSDGGRYLDTDSAIDHARRLIDQGADIIDVGGESTRPGSEAVDAESELRRVIPVIEQLVHDQSSVVSVDTSKSTVALHAIEAGAKIVNDVTAGTGDADMISVLANSTCGIIIMHMLGVPKTMQSDPAYNNVVFDVGNFLKEKLEAMESAGIHRTRIVADPGIGFGKNLQHNLTLMANLSELVPDRPICLGASRKRFLNDLLSRGLDQRLAGSLGTNLAGWMSGAHILRVHDVQETLDAVQVLHAIRSHRN